jgi:hypothetical protein
MKTVAPVVTKTGIGGHAATADPVGLFAPMNDEGRLAL